MIVENTGAIILGGHIQAYGIVQILGDSGIPSIVINSTNMCIARHSKFCVGFYQAGHNDIPVLLSSFIEAGKYEHWMLIPTDDYHVRYLSMERKKLNTHFVVAADEWSHILYFFDKCLSYPLVSACGVPTPVTFYPQSDELSNDIVDNITYPCIIKPAVMRDFYAIYRTKAVVCDNRNKLIDHYNNIIRQVSPSQLMVQEIIPGGSEQQYSVGVFFDGTAARNYLIARRRRQHPLDFGNATTYAESVEHPMLLDYAVRILTKVGYTGVCEVEFKQDQRDGKFKFLEVNPRLWKWHLLAKQLGVPILENYRAFLYNQPSQSVSKNQKGAWRDVVTDIPVCIQLMLKGKYKRAEKVPTVAAVWNREDPIPFVMQLAYLPYTMIYRR